MGLVQGQAVVVDAPAPARVRLVGIDLARALAFGGMLLAHFAGSLAAGDPGWLQVLDDAADGRAAPLFCVLLGVGAGILAARDATDALFVRRGLVLFALGLAIWPVVEEIFLILPHYGLLLALFPLWRRIPRRWLLPAAALAFAVPSLVSALTDSTGLRGAGQPESYGDLVDVASLAWQLLWTGGYPVVGWVGFVLVGMWVAGHDLAAVGVQWRLLAVGVAVGLGQPLVAAAGGGAGGFLDASAHSNQMAWYVFASATAVATIAACLLVTRRPPGAVGPVVSLGQAALSAYLLHIVVGELFVWEWRRQTEPTLAAQMLLAVGVFAALAAAATAWRARYRRGPVEALMRAVSG